MDKHTPPPSYEAATGVPAGQNLLFGSYPITSPPSLPPYDNELNPVSVMTPILKQPYIKSSYIRPYNPISYPVTRSTPEVDALIRQDQYKNDSKICVCFFVTVIALILLVAIFVLVGRKATAKYSGNELRSQTFNTIESHNHHKFNNWRPWRIRNNELYEQVEEDRKEPNWDFSN